MPGIASASSTAIRAPARHAVAAWALVAEIALAGISDPPASRGTVAGLRNFQRDQTTGRSSAHAAGRRDPLRLRHADGGNPQGQRAARGCGRLRRDGHAWAKLVRQITQAYGR